MTQRTGIKCTVIGIPLCKIDEIEDTSSESENIKSDNDVSTSNRCEQIISSDIKQESMNYDLILINDKILNKIKEKYFIALKVINFILHNANLKTISDLTHFSNVDRQIIIAKKNEDSLNTLLQEIYLYFGKRECQFGQKEKTKHYIITIMKNMCKQLTLHLKKKYKNIQRNGHVTSYILYSIDYS